MKSSLNYILAFSTRISEVQRDEMPNDIKDIHTVDEDTFPYIFEQNVTINLKSSPGLIRCNIYRPKNVDRTPALVTYGPYGKDIHYKEYVQRVKPSVQPSGMPVQ